MKDGLLSSNTQNKFIAFIGVCFAVMLLSAFFLTLFGVIDLRIAEQINFNPAIEFIIEVLNFLVDMYFVFSISIRIFDNRIFKILALYAPIHIINCILFESCIISSTIIPIIYAFLVNLYLKNMKTKDFIINTLFMILFIGAYQQLSLYVKLSIFSFKYAELNSITYMIYSIDYILFFALYMMGVKRYYAFISVCPESNSIQQIPEHREESLDLSDLKAHQRFIFWVLATGYQVFQLIVVLAIGFINNAFIEILVMLAVFWLGRPILKQSWHSDSLVWCSIVTFSGFYILTKIALPLSVSLFSCIALSVLFVYILHRAGIHEDEYRSLKDYKQEREDFKAKSRRSRAKIVLQTLSLTHIDFNMLNDYANGETLEILADKYNMSFSTVNRRINALTQM